MIRELRPDLLRDDTVNVKYEIPADFDIAKPDYHVPIATLMNKESSIGTWAFPTVIYAIPSNAKKGRYSKEYTQRAVFTWNCKHYSLPGHDTYRNTEEHEHYFKQYVEPGHFNYNADFFDYIREAEEAGFGEVIISVGIWTNEGILNESFLPYPIDIKLYAKVYFGRHEELAIIYNNSPELIKFKYESVFTSSMPAIDESSDKTICRWLIDNVFSYENVSGFEPHASEKQFIGSQGVLLHQLNSSEYPILESRFTLLMTNGNKIEIDYKNFLTLLCCIRDDSFTEVVDKKGVVHQIDDILKSAKIDLHHFFTEYGQKLRRTYDPDAFLRTITSTD